MAVGVLRDLPGVPAELIDAVVRELDLDAEPATGPIFNTAGLHGDNVWREFNVWESREAWEAFYRDRIISAVIAVLGEDAVMNGPQPPAPTYMEVHHVVT